MIHLLQQYPTMHAVLGKSYRVATRIYKKNIMFRPDSDPAPTKTPGSDLIQIRNPAFQIPDANRAGYLVHPYKTRRGIHRRKIFLFLTRQG